MKMFDVLGKLKEIEAASPEVSEAIKSVEAMSPTVQESTEQVDEGVNITVSGNDAVLSQILKLAGMIGAQTTEAMEDETRPYDNSPAEEIADIDAVIASGDDMHKATDTFNPVAGADNPMQETETEIFATESEDEEVDEDEEEEVEESAETVNTSNDALTFLRALAGLK